MVCLGTLGGRGRVEPVGVGTELCWSRGHRGSTRLLVGLAGLGYGLREEAAGLCRGSSSRRGQQVSLLASRIKARLKTRCSHYCSRAGCWPPCLEYFPLPVLLQGRGEVNFRHIYTLKHRGSGRTSQTDHCGQHLSRLSAGKGVTKGASLLSHASLLPWTGWQGC